MSVPSIRFRGQGPRRGRGSPGIRGSQQRTAAQENSRRQFVTFSSSSSSDDELPVIETKRQDSSTPFLNLSSSDESSGEVEVTKPEQSWAASPSPLSKTRPPPKRRIQPDPEPESESKSSSEVKPKTPPRTPPRSRTKTPPKPKPKEEEEYEEEYESTSKEKPEAPPRQQKAADKVAATPEPAPAGPRDPAPDSFQDMEIFNVAWTKKRFGKTNIRMTKNDRKLYFAKGGKVKGLGKGFIFSSSTNFQAGSDDCIGVLIARGGKSRFSLYDKNCENELLGLGFYGVGESVSGGDMKRFLGRAFRIAIPEQGQWVPQGKEDELSRIAKMNEQRPSVRIIPSKLPVRTDGRLVMKFGDVFVISSIKNFVVELEGRTVFMIYKSSSGTVTVKIAPPITPVMAFGLAVAIISSDK